MQTILTIRRLYGRAVNRPLPAVNNADPSRHALGDLGPSHQPTNTPDPFELGSGGNVTGCGSREQQAPKPRYTNPFGVVGQPTLTMAVVGAEGVGKEWEGCVGHWRGTRPLVASEREEWQRRGEQPLWEWVAGEDDEGSAGLPFYGREEHRGAESLSEVSVVEDVRPLLEDGVAPAGDGWEVLGSADEEDEVYDKDKEEEEEGSDGGAGEELESGELPQPATPASTEVRFKIPSTKFWNSWSIAQWVSGIEIVYI